MQAKIFAVNRLLNIFFFSFFNLEICCCDTVGWATGRTSGLQKVGCWFVGGDDMTWALHVL